MAIMYEDECFFDSSLVCAVFDKSFGWINHALSDDNFDGEWRMDKQGKLKISLNGIVKLKKHAEKEAEKNGLIMSSRLEELFPLLYEIGANYKRSKDLEEYILDSCQKKEESNHG